jgi:hypothetical protein
MFEEVDKGIDTVTACYVKLRLMRCGLAIVRRLFEWLLFLFCGESIIGESRLGKNVPSCIKALERSHVLQ